MIFKELNVLLGFPGNSDSKESACMMGNQGLIPELARTPGEGNGYPLWYSCLGNPMDRGAWQATAHGDAKESDMTKQLKLPSLFFHFPLRTSYDFSLC